MNWNTVETKTENVFQQPRPPDIYQVNLRLTTFTAIYLIRWREKPSNMSDLKALKLTLMPENRKGCVRANFSSFDSCRNGGRVESSFPFSAYFPKRRIKRGSNYWICFLTRVENIEGTTNILSFFVTMFSLAIFHRVKTRA